MNVWVETKPKYYVNACLLMHGQFTPMKMTNAALHESVEGYCTYELSGDSQGRSDIYGL